MKKIGQKIRESRRRQGMLGEELGRRVGLGKSAISQIENNLRKDGPDPKTLVKIADALNDLSILAEYCAKCPIKEEVFLRLFPDLNNINRVPAVIASRLRKELDEAESAASELAELLSNRDFQGRPGFMDDFRRHFEQIIDAKRCIESLEWELIISGAIRSKDLREVYALQQQKCVDHGHHKPEAIVDTSTTYGG